MGDDAEYEMERMAEERMLKAAQGPRDIHEVLEDVQVRIANAKSSKLKESRAKRS